MMHTITQLDQTAFDALTTGASGGHFEKYFVSGLQNGFVNNVVFLNGSDCNSPNVTFILEMLEWYRSVKLSPAGPVNRTPANVTDVRFYRTMIFYSNNALTVRGDVNATQCNLIPTPSPVTTSAPPPWPYTPASSTTGGNIHSEVPMCFEGQSTPLNGVHTCRLGNFHWKSRNWSNNGSHLCISI